MRREFLQLADTYAPAKHKIAGFLISEKLDGTRCFWDGGISRGVPTEQVPYASVIDPKTGAKKAKIKPYATGLWSRYGNPIIAPDWFLNTLPSCPLDGELWAGRGNFQLCRSICAGDTPDERFRSIQYAVYSTPPLNQIFRDGEIKNPNFHAEVNTSTVFAWLKQRTELVPEFAFIHDDATFDGELLFLRDNIPTQDDRVFMHHQVKLPMEEEAARAFAMEFVERILDKGGEGAVIRDPNATWTPKRHKGLLKFKPFEDSEGDVIGFVAGKQGKQGNVLGKIGALIVRWGKIEFEIGSGLTFEDRTFKTEAMVQWAKEHPGEKVPANFDGWHIKKGDTVTFKYRELTDDGIPKEGRYWRMRKGVE